MSLIDQLVSQLGIDQGQARGGVGVILNTLKGSLGGEDYAKVADAVPEAEQLAGEAPAADDAGSGGLMGALGGLASSVGGGVGGLAGLVAGFSKLGLGADQVQGFVGTFLGFLKSNGANDAAAAVESAVAE